MGNKRRLKRKKKRRGFVYILSNPALKRGLIKIGHTTKTPEERAKQLYSTGIPQKFTIVYKMEFKDSFKAEKQIHLSLENYRYNNQREFFTCSLTIAKNAINHADGKINPQNTDNPIFQTLFSISIFISIFILTLWLVLNN